MAGSINQSDKLSGKVGATKNLSAAITPNATLKASVSKPKNSFVCDSELSLESENPVQNKVVTEALNNKANTLNIAKNTDIDKLFK